MPAAYAAPPSGSVLRRMAFAFPWLFEFSEAHLGFLTLAVQVRGFIVGTLWPWRLPGLAEPFSRQSLCLPLPACLAALITVALCWAASEPTLRCKYRAS